MEKISNIWYILPIILGLIGCIILWFALKNRDRKRAKEMAINGIVISIIIAIALMVVPKLIMLRLGLS